MDRKWFTCIRTTLIVVIFIVLMGSIQSSYAQDPQPSPNPDFLPRNSLQDPVAALEDLPNPMIESGLIGEALRPLAFELIPRDDRDNSYPTDWKILYHQTAEDVNNTSRGYRLVDIYVESISPHIFTGVYVKNSDSYQKTWWWYYGVDEATLNQHLEDNNARLIALKAYDNGLGQIRFTAIMIENTGKDATAWWWYYNATDEDINTLIDDNEARLTQINAYETLVGQIRYAAVMVDNTGDNGKAWWWYINANPSTVSTLLQTNNARLVDMDIDPDTGNLNVIMTSCASGCPYWWWYVNVPEDQLLHIVNQNGARVIDVNDHPGCGSTCYDIILINNSNAITTRVGEMLRSGTDGTKGLYLERVDGSVLANLMNDTIFEPASTLKVGVHLHTILQIRDNPDVNHLTLIPAYPPLIPPDSCPDDPAAGTETIYDADRKMMRYSDNATTRELVDFFNQLESQPDINATMDSIGMTDSSINHVFGCGGPPANETTLDDLATLYRGVANGSLIDLYDRELFFVQMAGTYMFNQEGWDFTHLVDTDIPLIITQEAPTGMPTMLKDAYQDDIFLAYKAGGYDISGMYYRSIFGYAEIPFCNAEEPHQYVFGIFIADATDKDNANDTFDITKAELLREQIRAGLASCFNQNYLPVIVK